MALEPCGVADGFRDGKLEMTRHAFPNGLWGHIYGVRAREPAAF